MKKIEIILVLILLVIAVLVFIKIYQNNQKIEFPKPTQQLWGAYAGDNIFSFKDFQEKIGQQADISAVFVGWNDPFPKYLASPLKFNNQTIVIFWEPYAISLDDIIAGKLDQYIKQFALDSKLYEGKIILVPFHEMNGNWNPWSGVVGNNTPAKVVLAFKHVHDMFLEQTNVKWGWAINNDSVPDTPQNAIENYYPGDNYVDYVGVDGFNFGDPWQTFNEIFSSSLQQLKKYKKPMYIFSMASADGPKKSVWIADAISQIRSDKDIIGWIWFNENKEKNWLIWSDEKSLKAFQEGIK